MFFPLLLKEGFSCLIVGGGNVASRKIEMLVQIPCSLTVIAPRLTDAVSEAVKRKRARWLERRYAPGDCEGFQLVIAATSRREVNRQVFEEAKKLQVPVNVVDDPEISTVIFPAVWRSGPLLLAVSTEGIAPFLSVEIRDRLADYALHMGRWVEIGGRFREVVRKAIQDEDEKNQLYRRFLDACQPDRLAAPPTSADLSDWLSWLDHLESGCFNEG